jgi:predicted DNA-binding protein (MmcQ/YjbR family)
MMTNGKRRYRDDVPEDVEVRLRELCLSLPGAYEERAWAGIRWKVRARTFAQVLGVETPSASPVVVLSFRSAGEELEVLRHAMGMVVDGDTDWDEVRELVTESFCVLAPKKLTALINRTTNSEP